MSLQINTDEHNNVSPDEQIFPNTPHSPRSMHKFELPATSLDSSNLPAFALAPVSFSTVLQCRLERKKSIFGISFSLFTEKENVLLLAAHQIHRWDYHIATIAGTVGKKSPNYLGKVEKEGNSNVFIIVGKGGNYRKQKEGNKASPSPEQKVVVTISPRNSRSPVPVGAGTGAGSGAGAGAGAGASSDPSAGSSGADGGAPVEEDIFDPFDPSSVESQLGFGDADDDDPAHLREQLGIITFKKVDKKNTTLDMHIPQVSEVGVRQRLVPTCAAEDIINVQKTAPHSLLQLVSRNPTTHATKGRQQLDFGSRTVIPSEKNYQVIVGSNPDLGVEQRPNALQLGKIDDSHYSVDICWPFCPLQAFALTLAIFLKHQ